MYTTAEQAIADSKRHDKIAHFFEHNAQIAAILQRDCEDSAEADGVLEFWGTDEDGSGWRVHMAAEPAKAGAGYWAVDTGDGNELCSGLSEFEAPGVAQGLANKRGESVYLYEVGSDDEPEEVEPDDGEDE